MPQETAPIGAREERRRRERNDRLPDIRAAVQADRLKLAQTPVCSLDLKERMPTRR
jgi:hypothetical protein